MTGDFAGNGDYTEQGYLEFAFPKPRTPCYGDCVEENGYWGSNYCWTDDYTWGAPCIKQGAGTWANVFNKCYAQLERERAKKRDGVWVHVSLKCVVRCSV